MEVFIGLYPDMCQVDFGGRPSCHKMAKFYVVIFISLFYINLYMTFRNRGGRGGEGLGSQGGWTPCFQNDKGFCGLILRERRGFCGLVLRAGLGNSIC